MIYTKNCLKVIFKLSKTRGYNFCFESFITDFLNCEEDFLPFNKKQLKVFLKKNNNFRFS